MLALEVVEELLLAVASVLFCLEVLAGTSLTALVVDEMLLLMILVVAGAHVENDSHSFPPSPP